MTLPRNDSCSRILCSNGKLLHAAYCYYTI